SDILTHGLPPLRFESAAIFRYRLSSRRTSWKPPVSRPFTDMLGMLIFIARLGLSRYEIWPVIDVCCPDIVVWEVTAAWNVLISLAFGAPMYTACSAARAALADFGSLPDALLPPPPPPPQAARDRARVDPVTARTAVRRIIAFSFEVGVRTLRGSLRRRTKR